MGKRFGSTARLLSVVYGLIAMAAGCHTYDGPIMFEDMDYQAADIPGFFVHQDFHFAVGGRGAINIIVPTDLYDKEIRVKSTNESVFKLGETYSPFYAIGEALKEGTADVIVLEVGKSGETELARQTVWIEAPDRIVILEEPFVRAAASGLLVNGSAIANEMIHDESLLVETQAGLTFALAFLKGDSLLGGTSSARVSTSDPLVTAAWSRSGFGAYRADGWYTLRVTAEMKGSLTVTFGEQTAATFELQTASFSRIETLDVMDFEPAVGGGTSQGLLLPVARDADGRRITGTTAMWSFAGKEPFVATTFGYLYDPAKELAVTTKIGDLSLVHTVHGTWVE